MARCVITMMAVALTCSCSSSDGGGEEEASLPEYLPEAPAGKQWIQAFADEFNGSTIDSTYWSHSKRTPPGEDQPRQDGFWREDAVYLDGAGHLVISVYEDGGKYISGGIRTIGKFEKAFGYFVCRARLQSQPGHWPAFWLYSDVAGNIGAGATDGAEIDVMEKFSLDNWLQSAIHWDGYGEHHQAIDYLHPTDGVMEGYHTFAVWWTPTEYIFYVDGVEKWRTDGAEGGVCQVPLYIKLTEEVGSWAGDITQAVLPDYFTVDYVRVYDLVDL